MKSKFIILISSILFLQIIHCEIFEKLHYKTEKLPIYSINLDLPVKERYKDIMEIYKDKIKVYAYVTSFTPLAYIISKLGRFILNEKYQDPEWTEYIKLVSEVSGITLSQSVMLSVTYDMACTSVVVSNRDGKIIMGRNLDFSTYFVISHLMYEAHYFKNGEFFYRGVELAGFRGAINAVKPGKFAASLNLRKSKYNFRLSNLYRIMMGKPTPNFNLMKVMVKAENYEQAFELLKNEELSAPVYYTVAGIERNEGAIISRESSGVYHIDYLDVDNNKWFLAVANSDIDQEQPDDERRTPTMNNILKIGRNNINYDNLFSEVMSEYPTNQLITAYTTIQSAFDNGYFNTTLWLP